MFSNVLFCQELQQLKDLSIIKLTDNYFDDWLMGLSNSFKEKSQPASGMLIFFGFFTFLW